MAYKQAKRTQKAHKALQLVWEIYNIPPEVARRDREAVQFAYQELEMLGYKWIASKQEWALVGDGAGMGETPVIDFMIMLEGENTENGIYVMSEGLKAAGYEITHTCVSSAPISLFGTLIHIQVRK